MDPGQGSSALRGPVRGLMMEPAGGMGCGLFSMSARGARATIPTSSRTGSFVVVRDGDRKTPGGHRESTESPGGSPGEVQAQGAHLPLMS